MNLLEVRTQFVELLGDVNLVTDTSTYSDAGADYFINAGQRYLDRKLDIPQLHGRAFVQVAPGQSLVLLEDLRAIEGVWKNTSDRRSKLDKRSMGWIYEKYPEWCYTSWNACIGGHFDSSSELDTYWSKGSWVWASPGIVYASAAGELKQDYTLNPLLKFPDTGINIDIYFTVMHTVGGLVDLAVSNGGNTEILSDVTPGRKKVTLANDANNTEITFVPTAGGVALDDIYFILNANSGSNGTSKYYARTVLNPAPQDLARSLYGQSYMGNSFSTLYGTEGTMYWPGREKRDGILIAPPPDEYATIEVFGLFYTPKMVNDTDETFWSVNHSDILIEAAFLMYERFWHLRDRAARAASINELLLDIHYDAVAEESAEIDQIREDY